MVYLNPIRNPPNSKLNRMKKSVIGLLVLSICMLLVNCRSSVNKKSVENPPPDSIVYKQTPQGDLKLYFHYPDDWKAEDQRPLIVFFFGGGWSGGSVEQFRYQAEYLARRGMVSVRADYRVSGRHGTLPDKCVEDGKSAVRWVRENALILGADPDKIVASGGSAGGHFAICAMVTIGLEAEGEDLTVSSKPNLMVLYNPVLSTSSDGFIKRLDSEEMALKISPNDHLDELVPPVIMFFGSADRLIEFAYENLELSSELGLDTQLWIAEGEAHGFFNKSPWLESTVYLTDKFLAEKGYIEGDPLIEISEDGMLELYHLP